MEKIKHIFMIVNQNINQNLVTKIILKNCCVYYM